MPMTQISLSGLETETDSVTSKTSVSSRVDSGAQNSTNRQNAQTLQDMINPPLVSNTQKDILQIIRKEEDHAMSLLAASPLLSSLFLTYANKAATLDGPQAPSPIDVEWADMNAMNAHLQEEVAALRAQLAKEADRAKMAEDCVEALRAQLSSVKDANRTLETTVSNEQARSEAAISDYAEYKKETVDTISELRVTMNKEAVSYTVFFFSCGIVYLSHLTTGHTSRLESGYRGPASDARPIEGGE